MRIASILLFSVLAFAAYAQPDRDGLIEAWKSQITNLGGKLENGQDEVFVLHDESLSYQGTVNIVSTLIRPASDSGYGDISFSHSGFVEFQLSELPPERAASQVYYYWASDRQNFYYASESEQWMTQAQYNESLQRGYQQPPSALGWFLEWGIWIVILLLICWLFLFLGRSQKKAKSLMGESANINTLARENIERSAELQNEMAGLARKNAQLLEDNNVLLRQILEAVNRSH